VRHVVLDSGRSDGDQPWLLPEITVRSPRVMKSFLTACGLTNPLQLVVESQSSYEGELRLLNQPYAVIGRDPRADVVLDHAKVSRRHIYVQVVDGEAFWIDLESRTGTRGNGDSQKSGWLGGGGTVRAGPYVIRRFTDESLADRQRVQSKLPEVAPLVAQAYGRAPLPEVTLEFLNGPAQSTIWPVRRVMSLMGSATGCKFRLTDPSVSRFHGSLLRTAAGLWIVDLLGQGGITVNDRPVRFGPLADGDVLMVGRYQIRVHCRPTRERSTNGSADRDRPRSPARLPRNEQVSSGLTVDEWAAAATSLTQVTGEANLPQFPTAIQAVPAFPTTEVMASEPAFPRKFAASELNESMLVPLVNQFGLMQQQMFDQFQQAMAMMVQMFGTMHRDQMEVIRAELDRLHDLTEEFHALKNELAQRTQVQPAETAPLGPAELGQATTTEPRISPQAPTFERSGVKQPAQVRPPSGIQPPSSTSRVPERQSSSTSPHFTERAPSKPVAAQPPPSERVRAADHRLQAKNDDASPAADSERDSVAWLHQRIMALQQERETRWQKILKLLPGVS
jgi:pSer/pThr/pTyr-binding forkhead associated (FHA) protein